MNSRKMPQVTGKAGAQQAENARQDQKGDAAEQFFDVRQQGGNGVRVAHQAISFPNTAPPALRQENRGRGTIQHACFCLRQKRNSGIFAGACT